MIAPKMEHRFPQGKSCGTLPTLRQPREHGSAHQHGCVNPRDVDEENSSRVNWGSVTNRVHVRLRKVVADQEERLGHGVDAGEL